MQNKVKLFNTVREIAKREDCTLTASEVARLEAETADLLRNYGKTAMKAPAGFEAIIEKLKNVGDVDAAFALLKVFLEEQDIEIEMEEGEPEEDKEDKPDLPLDKPDLPLDKPDLPLDKPDLPLDKEDKEDKPDLPLDKEDKEDKPDLPLDKPDLPLDKEEDLKDKRDKLMAQAKDMHNKMRRMQDEVKDEELEKSSEEEMGVDLEAGCGKDKRVSKVSITKNRNVVAWLDDKPAFMAVPSKELRENKEELIKWSNSLLSLIKTEGVEKAARKCGANIIGGVDSNIDILSDVDVEEGKSVLEGAEFVSDEGPEQVSMSDKATDGAEFVTEEKPDKVVADITDGADDVIKEPIDKNHDDVISGADFVSEEKPVISDPISKDVSKGGEIDFKEAENNFKKLYAARANKIAEEKTASFIKKFIKCANIASVRMLLNHDEHPFKAAAFDVLTAKDVHFSDGDLFSGIPVKEASELVELMAAEGHADFIGTLLDRTASLMEKSDEYLNDVEDDLVKLSAIPPHVEENGKKGSSNKLRKQVTDGNFEMISKVAVQKPNKRSEVDRLRDAISSSRVGCMLQLYSDEA